MSPVFQSVGTYRIVRRLGRGGMADVFLAEDTEQGLMVALKLIDSAPDRDSQDAIAAERRGALLQERLCGLDLRVPLVHGYGELDGAFFVAMEYVEGEDLATLVRQAPIPVDRAVEIAIEVCGMLATAHAMDLVIDGDHFRGVIHGDIKPRNIRLDRDGRVKILDFGIAKALSLTRKLTRNEFGSVAYSSPERLDSGDVDAHSDLWSVAVLLYEMVAGRQPFEGDITRRLEDAIRSRRPPQPLPPETPAPLRHILARAFAPDLSNRYASAADFRDDLLAFREGRITVAEQVAAAEVLDTDPTRRTRAPAGRPGQADPALDPDPSSPPDSDRTRRTMGVPPIPSAPVAPSAPSAPSVRPAPAARRWHVRRPLRLFLLVFSIVLGANEVRVMNGADALTTNLAFKTREEMDDVWKEYERLADRSRLGFGLSRVREPLKERLVQFADRIIANYRSDRPTVRERDWQDAQRYLTRAVSLDRRDRDVRARLRYCEGHLNRINGEVRVARKAADAPAHLNDAVVAFEEAARLRSRWPDPYLGLARTYIYGFDDIDKAREAMQRAERAGYELGNREVAQLADGYRRRGERLWRASLEVRDLPQEMEHLKKAADADRDALELYERILGYGEAGRHISTTQRHLETVEARISELAFWEP